MKNPPALGALAAAPNRSVSAIRGVPCPQLHSPRATPIGKPLGSQSVPSRYASMRLAVTLCKGRQTDAGIYFCRISEIIPCTALQRLAAYCNRWFAGSNPARSGRVGRCGTLPSAGRVARPISALRHGIAKQWGLVLAASLDRTHHGAWPPLLARFGDFGQIAA